MNNEFEHIDKLFSDNLNGDSITPPSEVWTGVQSALATKAAAGTIAGKSLLIKWIAGIVLATGSVSTLIYLKTKTPEPVIVTDQKNSGSIDNDNTVSGNKAENNSSNSSLTGQTAQKGISNTPKSASSVKPAIVGNNPAFRGDTKFEASNIGSSDRHSFPNPTKEANNRPVRPEAAPYVQQNCRNGMVLSSKKENDRTFTFTAGKFRSIAYWIMGGYRLNNTGSVQTYNFSDDLAGRVFVKVFGTNLTNCFDSSVIELILDKPARASEICLTSAEIFGSTNVFTPNGDNFNDVYTIQRASELKDFEVSIIDPKTGTEVYKTERAENNSWNGKTMGREAAQGWYRVIVKFTCNGTVKVYKKDIQLLR